MTDTTLPAMPPKVGLLLLLQVRTRVLRNIFFQTARERPLKLASTGASIMVIWIGLYILLSETFRLVRQPVLEGIVATPLIFTFFFLALTAMLTFSNAILSYGGLFRRPESSYLLVAPINPRDLVLLRYLESLVLSSWSLLLLGVPLMLALARQFDEPWTFYPLFLGLFILFIPIPGAAGLTLAWLVAMFTPRTPQRMILLVAVLAVGIAGWWMYGIVYAPFTSADWLKNFYNQVAILQNALLPHTWVSKGITYAVQGQPSLAGFYLFVTSANALFVSVVAVALVTAGFSKAFARAQVAGNRSIRRSGRIMEVLGEILFAYLPRPQRILAAKDLKMFLRDPLQWSQMAILVGLLGLYVSNVQYWWTELANPSLQVLIAFLNQTAVCLILATFTSRFVFPMVSLEGQQLWMLGLLPINRGRIILAKFLFALTITLTAAIAVMSVSVYRLQLPSTLAGAHLAASVAVCVGLCGISIGMGARMPVFQERNPARIAGSFGGTISLLLSVCLVVASLGCLAAMSLQVTREGDSESLTLPVNAWLILVMGINGIAALVAIAIGIRHFKRLES